MLYLISQTNCSDQTSPKYKNYSTMSMSASALYMRFRSSETSMVTRFPTGHVCVYYVHTLIIIHQVLLYSGLCDHMFLLVISCDL